jgi:hypothetical protein
MILLIIPLFFLLYSSASDYINQTLAIECINQETLSYQYQKKRIYAHKKFNKVVDFSYHYTIKESENKENYELHIILLMYYFDDSDVSLIGCRQIPENEFEWHIIVQDTPIEYLYHKDKTLEDILIFGRHSLKHGNLFSLSTTIPKSSVCNDTILLSLAQPHRKINFAINLSHASTEEDTD